MYEHVFVSMYSLPTLLQLLDMMGSFLERPLIQKDFNPNYQVLVRMCDQELNNAKIIFNDQLSRACTPQGVLECMCVCMCIHVQCIHLVDIHVQVYRHTCTLCMLQCTCVVIVISVKYIHPQVLC